MQCPSCNHPEDRVVDSRTSRGGRATRRRRECLACEYRFTTYEQVEEEPLLIQKKSGGNETYDRGKIISSIQVACTKRPVSNAQIETLVDGVEEALQELDSREVPSLTLGELVMDRLRNIDQVAYVRFASVYREFKDVHDFVDELEPMLKETQPK